MLVFVLLMIFHFSGGHLLYHIQQKQIRKEIKRRIKNGVPKEELRHFSFGKKELENVHWINDHEFLYQKQLFDIVHKHQKGNRLEIACIEDQQEEALFSHLDQLCRKHYHKSPAKEQQAKLPLWLSEFFFAPDYPKLHCRFKSSSKHFFFFNRFPISDYPSPPTSPPRFILAIA